jgi:hypothetical protein
MNKILLTLVLMITYSGFLKSQYAWTKSYNSNSTIEKLIPVPEGYKRVDFPKGSFAEWLRKLPLKQLKAPVRLWNGKLKNNQAAHIAVVDMDLIGEDLQQCIDAIIRLRSEYLWTSGKANEVKFSYTCCAEKVGWAKWQDGWRTKIVKKHRIDSYEWVKTAGVDNTYKNFRDYLYSVMMYAGTLSLSNDMKKIKASEVACGDAYVQGAAPGYGHGVIILDMAVSPSGKRIMLLGQSYMPAQEFHVLRNIYDENLTPWFEVDFGDKLYTPEWTFTKEHARRF